jgi:hypothetical protein
MFEGVQTIFQTIKMLIFQLEIHYLGHIISSEGIVVNLAKIEVINEWMTPTNVHEVRSFMGMTVYDRRFMEGFSQIVNPITSLIEKEASFAWIK